MPNDHAAYEQKNGPEPELFFKMPRTRDVLTHALPFVAQKPRTNEEEQAVANATPIAEKRHNVGEP